MEALASAFVEFVARREKLDAAMRDIRADLASMTAKPVSVAVSAKPSLDWDSPDFAKQVTADLFETVRAEAALAAGADIATSALEGVASSATVTSTIVGVLTGDITAMTTALTFLATNPIGIAITAMAGLGVAIAAARKEGESFGDTLLRLTDYFHGLIAARNEWEEHEKKDQDLIERSRELDERKRIREGGPGIRDVVNAEKELAKDNANLAAERQNVTDLLRRIEELKRAIATPTPGVDTSTAKARWEAELAAAEDQLFAAKTRLIQAERNQKESTDALAEAERKAAQAAAEVARVEHQSIEERVKKTREAAEAFRQLNDILDKVGGKIAEPEFATKRADTLRPSNNRQFSEKPQEPQQEREQPRATAAFTDLSTFARNLQTSILNRPQEVERINMERQRTYAQQRTADLLEQIRRNTEEGGATVAPAGE